MKKRLLAILLALSMALTLLPGAALAAEGEEIGFLDFSGEEYDYLDNALLFDAYVAQLVFGEEFGIGTYGDFGRAQLTAQNETGLYTQLLEQIAKVADGTRASSEFTLSGLTWDSAAAFKASLGKVMKCIITDHPEYLYWWGRYQTYSNSETPTSVTLAVDKMFANISGKQTTYKVKVQDAAGNITEKDRIAYLEADNTKITAANAAINNAQTIIDSHADEDDYTKLKSYKEEICRAVEYNTEASKTSPYDYSVGEHAWQIIYVFDGIDTTNVVCEGYAKAFQYLCNNSIFKNDKIACYSVTGDMGGGGHMWNVVTMEDGNSYLVDVTNCDLPATGSDGTALASQMPGGSTALFLVGAESGTMPSYVINRARIDLSGGYIPSADITYVYDDDTVSTYGNRILALPNTAYVYTPPVQKQNPTCNAPAGLTATYGQTLNDITLTNPTGNTEGTWAWENSSQSVGNVGSNKFKATFTPNDQTTYNTVTDIEVTVTVNVKNISTVTIADIPNQPYTGSAITPDITVTGGGITLVKDTDYTVEYSGNTNVGQATVTVKPKSDGNYTFTQATKNFTITAKPASITISTPGTITYDGSPVTAAGTSGADLIYTYDGDSSTVTVKWYGSGGTELGSAPQDAGAYQIGVSAAAGSNSAAVPEVKQNFTISPADYTYAGPGAQSSSVGAAHPAATSASATGVNSETVSGQLTWFTDAACTSPANGTFTTVGATTLYWKFTPAADAKNYVSTPKTGSAVFTVDDLPQQTLAFADAGPVTKTFGDAEFTNAATNENGGAVTYTSSVPTVATVNATTGEVTIVGAGTTTITATAAATSTHAQTSASYTLTVNPKDITSTIAVTVASETYRYTGSAIEPAVTVKDGETTLDAGSYTVTYSNNTVPGTATATVTAKSGGNYTWTAKGANFTIGKATAPANQTQAVSVVTSATSGEAVLASPTVAGSFGTKSYTAAITTDTDGIISGAPAVSADGKLTFSLASDLAEKTGETATITVTVASQNYEDYTVTVTVTVVAKEAQAAPAAPVLTCVLNADRATYTVTIPAVANGEYSFDGTSWSDTNTLAGVHPGDTVTGYVRMKETGTHLPSPAASGSVTAPAIVTLTPTAAPAAGSYTGSVTVTLSCGDAGAAIYYTTDGSEPTVNEELRYTAPFTVAPPATVKAIALDAGKTVSAPLTAAYSQQTVDVPAFPAPEVPSGGGSGSSGSGSGSSGTQTPDTPAVTPSPSGQEVTAAPKAQVSGSTASAAVSGSTGRELVDQAVRNGSETVTISPSVSGSVSRTEVSIPSAVVGDIAHKTDAALKVETPAADVTIPNEALSSLAGRGGEVTVTAGTDNGIITLEIASGGSPVEAVSGGVTVAVSDPGCTAGTVAMLVKEDGSAEVIRQSVADAASGRVTVPLDGSARIVLVDNTKSFDDVPASSWASDAVAFVSSHELMNGSGEGEFTPNAPMTRAMLAVVLHNLENNPNAGQGADFPDVAGGGWYAEAVTWAAGRNIITGYATGEFGPDDEITREQLAVMLYRYAGSPAVSGGALPFSDASSVSGYARDAIAWAAANGIMSGKGDGVLDPQGGATRAEVAQMLLNFVAGLAK